MMNVTECVISCALLRYATPCYTLPTASKSHRSKQLLRSPPRFSGRGSQHPAALPKEQQSRYLGVWGGCIESALNLHWSTQCCMMPTWCCNMLHAAWVQAGCWVLLGNQSINSNIFKHQTAHTSVTSCQLFLPEASRRPNGSEWRSIQKVSAHYQRSLSVSQCVSQCLWCLASTGNSSMLGSVCMPTMSVSPILFGRSSNS